MPPLELDLGKLTGSQAFEALGTDDADSEAGSVLSFSSRGDKASTACQSPIDWSAPSFASSSMDLDLGAGHSLEVEAEMGPIWGPSNLPCQYHPSGSNSSQVSPGHYDLRRLEPPVPKSSFPSHLLS